MPYLDPEDASLPRVISNEWGRNKITQIEPDVVMKQGSSVWPNEEAAIQLVQAHLQDAVPVPSIYHATFERDDNGAVEWGTLYMDFIPGRTLRSAWPSLGEGARERVCRDTWAMIEKLRGIPRPEAEGGAFYCAADGSSKMIHPLLGDESDTYPPMKNDQALRDRIWERYVENNGLSYADGQQVRDMLPRSEVSVFTHGDIHPGNILVEDDGDAEGAGKDGNVKIVGLVDFESAGFYPDYWEYNEMVASRNEDSNWSQMMDRTKPKEWDVTGIMKARRVLF